MSISWWVDFARRLTVPRTRAQRRKQRSARALTQFETLELRDVPAAFTPNYKLLSSVGSATPFGTLGPTGYTPAQVRHAYGFDQISFNGVAGDGSGTTIAIVDAYNDPNVRSDLSAFDAQFGLPNPTLTVVNQTGGTTLPTSDTGWAGEIALDVEWAHAIAPGAKILLVEANSASYTDLFTAVKYAASQTGVVAVSMSWGGGEFSSETSYDSTFVTPTGHAGVSFFVSSGDSGAPTSYPATSPNVVSVGGTSLHLTSAGAYSSESGWSGSGGGISAYESQPTYQNGVVTQTTTKRANPDVSYDSDPNTGFPVYQTYGNSASTPWLQYGGTSAAAPQWAALVAIADQGRALAGLGSLASPSLLSSLYKLPSTDFHDVTSGTSSGSPNYTAGTGYDLVTGRGTPIANLVVADLVGTVNTNAVTHYSISAPTTATSGTSFSVTVTALNASNQAVTGYTGTVHFTSSDGLGVLPANYTFTAGDAGKHTFTVTLKTAGAQSVTATDTVTSSITGSASVTVSAPSFKVTGFPTTATAGTSGTVTVTAVDASGNTLTGYTGTVHFTSSDSQAVLPADATLVSGKGTFTVTFKTAGTQTLTATDKASATMTGAETGITVNPAAAVKLLFLQQPTNVGLGATIQPAVTVKELDAYGNVVTTDSTTQVKLAIGTNPGAATLTGGGPVVVSKGVATFSGVSLNAVGTGYTLVASAGTMSATSSTFNVTNNSSALETFESGLNNYWYTGSSYPLVSLTGAAAHDGSYGLDDAGDGNWYFRTDAASQVKPGDTLSAWVKFATAADGRAYLGFATTTGGTMSVALAANTGQLIIQNNSGFNFTDLASVAQSYVANQWYRVEVNWGTSGKVIAKLYGSDGTTLLNSVTASTGATAAGGFAFRATGHDKFFDTVTVTKGVNMFAAPESPSKPSDHAAAKALAPDSTDNKSHKPGKAHWNSEPFWVTTTAVSLSGSGSLPIV